jgi:phage-related baseplate assembly protein
VNAAGASDLVAYVGHDGLMDFALDHYEYSADSKRRDAVMLACASKSYFANALRWTGARPLVWTTGLMAPEAYVIEAVLSGWAVNDSDDQIRRRAAVAYDKYQHCGAKGALHLFATGW